MALYLAPKPYMMQSRLKLGSAGGAGGSPLRTASPHIDTPKAALSFSSLNPANNQTLAPLHTINNPSSTYSQSFQPHLPLQLRIGFILRYTFLPHPLGAHMNLATGSRGRIFPTTSLRPLRRMLMVLREQLDRDGRLCARFRPGKWQLSHRIPWHLCHHGKRLLHLPRGLPWVSGSRSHHPPDSKAIATDIAKLAPNRR